MQLKIYNSTTAKGKGLEFCRCLDGLGVLLGGFLKGSRDKTEYNNMQMKHMMDSFDAQKEKWQKREKS